MANPRAPKLAGEKVAFLLSLVPYLMDRDRVTVAEASAHFGVDEAQLREAVRLISVSGIPGETAQYQHGDLFDIEWDAFEERDEIVLTQHVAIDESPRFSGREAAALIAGLNYLSALPEGGDSAATNALMSKLARGASGTPTQLAVEVSPTGATLALIRTAVAGRVQLEFDYLNARGDRETRRVDPLRIDAVDNDWYLRAWCHSREAVRTFRLDRITNPVVTADAITRRAEDVLVVTIDVAAAALPLLAAYEAEVTDEASMDGHVRATVRVSHFHGLKRIVTTMSGEVIVVAPPLARDTVKAWADAALLQYTAP
jgi:proteasome accessory factor C